MLKISSKLRRAFRQAGMCTAFAAGLIAIPAAGQNEAADFPNKPIKFISSFAAGGLTDQLARYISKEMGDEWRQPVVIDTRTGAGGMIGTTAIAKSAPDGYSFGFITFSHLVQPALVANMPFDAVTDFTPITLFALMPTVICASMNSGLTSLAQMISEARAGKKISYGTSGIGTSAHIGVEQIAMRSGVKFIHVPYRGWALISADLVGGQISVGLATITSVVPLAKSGKCRPLAVAATNRSAVLPDVPTVAETIAGLEFSEPYMVVGPKGIPPAVALKLQRELKRIAGLPHSRDHWAGERGAEFVNSTPAEMGAYLDSNVKKWTAVVREIGIKAE